jgi:hypothetical protein
MAAVGVPDPRQCTSCAVSSFPTPAQYGYRCTPVQWPLRNTQIRFGAYGVRILMRHCALINMTHEKYTSLCKSIIGISWNAVGTLLAQCFSCNRAYNKLESISPARTKWTRKLRDKGCKLNGVCTDVLDLEMVNPRKLQRVWRIPRAVGNKGPYRTHALDGRSRALGELRNSWRSNRPYVRSRDCGGVKFIDLVHSQIFLFAYLWFI